MLFETPATLAAEYFVAPDGRDTQGGNIARPFASIQRAQQAANPGDTIHIRGGTYRIRDEQIARRTGIWSHVFEMDKSGTAEAPIHYRAYQDEKPVFDFSGVKAQGRRQPAGHDLPASGIRKSSDRQGRGRRFPLRRRASRPGMLRGGHIPLRHPAASERGPGINEEARKRSRE